jgi:1-deoxy-D-xylulose-5-phosphate reductoisomerase
LIKVKVKAMSESIKKIAILGSTGSIGKSALNIIESFKDKYSISLLAANTSVATLKEQIEKFNVLNAAVINLEAAKELKKISNKNVKIYAGENELIKALNEIDYDILLSSMVGFAGLRPTLEGIKKGKRIALANKETLVVAGELMQKFFSKYNAELLPVDSEHSAIFQCLVGEKKRKY